MKFLARIRKGSAVHNMWRGQSRLGGELRDVPFKWSIAEHQYLSTRPLEPAEVTLFDHHDSVQIEMIGEPVGAAVPRPPAESANKPAGSDEIRQISPAPAKPRVRPKGKI